MTTLTMSPTLGDLLKFELNGSYSREFVTLKSGTNYALGSVLGKITASGKYRLSPAAAVTGVAGCSPRRTSPLKLGFAVAQSTVAKYMARLDGSPPGQRWGTFVRNHMPHIAAMDLFVVPTFGFNLLYVLVVVRLARRELVWINVTSHPTAEWIAQQISEAFPWNEAPRYLIRDRDAIYGATVTRRLRAMGIRDNPSRRVHHGRTPLPSG